MKRKLTGATLVIILCLSCVSFMAFTVYAENANITNQKVKTVDGAWGNLDYYTTETSTHFDITLHKSSVLLVGRETWNAGDKIIFNISAPVVARCEIGILPAENLDTSPEYNSYGGFISEELSINSNMKEITITVPEAGEYGIGIRHYPTPEELSEYNASGVMSDIQLNLDVNKVFRNQLQK